MIELLDLADAIRAAEGDPKREGAAMLAATPATREQYTSAIVAYRQFAQIDYMYRAVRDDASRAPALIEAASPQARADLIYVLEERDPLDAAMRCRELRLAYLRDHPEQVPLLSTYFAMGNVADFIDCHAIAQDPRRVARGRNATVPFLTFRRQREMCDYLWRTYRAGKHGCIPKSREVGATATAMNFVTTMALFHPGFVGIMGSALERDIDNGPAESLFQKIRDFLGAVPEPFAAGYTLEKCSTNMRIIIPGNGASLIGQAGDNIGRGKRGSVLILDEHAFIPRAHLVAESVSATAKCVIGLSSVNGISGTDGQPNQFYKDAHSPGIEPFYFLWNDDDRVDPDTGKRIKDRAWYEEQVATLGKVIVAQTLDCDWLASIAGACIPKAHAQACVGLAKRLGIEPRGALRVAYDPAGNNGTGDKYGYAVMHGTHVIRAQTWSGLSSTESLRRMYGVLDELGAKELTFDVHGVGDHTPGEMESLEALRGPGRPRYKPNPFNSNRYKKTDKANEGVLYRPKDQIYGAKRSGGIFSKGVRMADIFGNYRAQAWGHLEWLAKNSYELCERLAKGENVGDVDPATLLFIDENIPEISQLLADLCQPAFRENSAGLKFVDKGSPSPTLGDCTMMASAPRSNLNWANVSDETIDQM
jgi:phage terminase large subunit